GVFGENIVEEREELSREKKDKASERGAAKDGKATAMSAAPGGPGGGFGGEPQSARRGMLGADRDSLKKRADEQQAGQGQPGGAPGQEPVVRKNFADTAYWNAALKTD